MINKDKIALILIDIQKGFDFIEHWGKERNNPQAELNASKILDVFRKKELYLFHIQHCSIEGNSPLVEGKVGNEFKELVLPKNNEVIIKKNVNSAFIGTNLKDLLDNKKITQLVIVGLTTDRCVSTTTRMAANYGYKIFLISDATATFNKKGLNGEDFSAEIIHQTSLASLNNEFATIIDT